MSSFYYKLVRCEWVALIYVVDQYEKEQREPPLYEKSFSTHKEAKENLDSVTVPDKFVPDRRRYPGAPHEYYQCTVRYRETVIWTRSLDGTDSILQ